MPHDISKLHLDILDENRQSALTKLKPLVGEFILGGGTALSLQINHRKSYDFDFFSQKELRQNLLTKLSQTIQIKEVSVNSSDELTFFDEDKIKYTFLYYYFPRYYSELTYNGFHIFPVKEIALHKAYTIGRRGAYRDYFDLYTILKNNYSTIEEIVQGASTVYKGVFSEKLFLEQLVYLDDITDFSIEAVDTKKDIPEPNAIKKYFEEIVSQRLDN